MHDRLYWLAWQLLLPGSAARVWSLVSNLGSFKDAWYVKDSELANVLRLKSPAANRLIERRANIDIEREYDQLVSKGIEFVCYHDDKYPQSLRTIFDPPPGIFVRGELRETAPGAALVGSRKSTAYGRKVAGQLGYDLARAGVTVVSGMARGVDTAAHEGAVRAGGYTVAVLGCGVDVVYPPENKIIMQQIIESGAVISEFPPQSAPEAWHFPVRNRVISGLSRCVVVVEAAERSGALITADVALEQSRDVLAVPGNISSRMSKGSNGLIKQGAKLVESAADILEEMGLYTLFPVEDDTPDTMAGIKLSPDENKIFNILCSEPMHLDEIIKRSGSNPGEVLSLLMYLEIKGVIKQLPGKMFMQE